MTMGERLRSAGGGALFLTALSCVSQLLGFCYRVALSRLVGAEVMGLYQLLMPVYSVLLSLTAFSMAGTNPAGVASAGRVTLRSGRPK